MKKILLTVCIIFSAIMLSQGQASIGGGLVYGTEIDELGIGIDGEFYLKNNISISPDIMIYFIGDGANFKRGFWEFNGNVNYYFVDSGTAAVYGIAGLSLGTASYKADGGNRSSNSELGLNIGIGSNFDINSSVKPFAEFKFTIGDYDQAVLFFGVKFPID